MPDHPVLTSIRLDEPVDAWASAGFVVGDGSIRLGGLRLEFDADRPPSLGFAADAGGSFAGIATHVDPPPNGDPVCHPNGVDGFDHVVVMTPDLDATLASVVAADVAVARTREARIGDAEVTQAFVVVTTAVIEIVGPRPGTGEAGVSDGARLWGLAAVASDLAACGEFWGEGCSSPRPAVQPGREIISVRRDALPSRYSLAVMSPRPGSTRRSGVS